MSDIPPEIVKKAKMIEIKTRKILDQALSSSFRSPFKGQGLQFAEHRVYVAGDDVRHIDWKVSARTREPHIKKYDEERELSVFVVVDQSASGLFGSEEHSKWSAIQEVSALIAQATFYSGEKVGLLSFSAEVNVILPPRKGRGHLNRVIAEVFSTEAREPKTNLSVALEKVDKVLKHAGVIFVVSDFQAEGYEKNLRRLTRRHDVVAVRVKDLQELRIPDIGMIPLRDPESGEISIVDTRSYRFQDWQRREDRRFEENVKSIFKKTGVEELFIETKKDLSDSVVRFFSARARKR